MEAIWTQQSLRATSAKIHDSMIKMTFKQPIKMTHE